MKTKINIPLAAIAAAVMAGCTTHVSRDISPEGVAGEVRFPDPARATLAGGTFPNLDNLRLVESGVTKDQLYDLLGRPHFREGFGKVREWDYLFNFRDGGQVRTCQYKVIFDSQYRGRSFHWQPAGCAEMLAVAPALAGAVAAGGRKMLEDDALFGFGRSAVEDINPEGRRRLVELARRLAGPDTESVEVLAYADRIGSSASNLALAQARAESVRSLLISEGVPSVRIRAIGIGAGNPVASCSDNLPRPAKVKCLAPDRRVEVRASIKVVDPIP
ncbi:outer membrane protein assembly factor BamE [Lysobacter pythonis]|uniref:Outer membrane protein assembly factor BamE n=1 Tax=Solilutibacter pythonis TaxID=2483112 RepID=A0A3M2HS97_9GAMM|nr:OmpA family protein [Lysobacter pythonis]RMH91125.1 outer membrane protein assembly factor BamE [Lysobacter pythonis]